MFQTSKNMKVSESQHLNPVGKQLWHTVVQVLPSCWFHIRAVDRSSARERIVLTGDLDVVESTVANQRIQLIEVNLVSPPCLNGTSGWRFDPLEQVYEIVRKDGDLEALVGMKYLLKDGRELNDHIDRRHSLLDLGNTCRIVDTRN